MAKFKLKKIAAIGIIGLQMITITACGSSTKSSESDAIINERSADTTDENTTEEANSNSIDASDSEEGTTVIYGQVTAIDGQNITIEVGTLNENGGGPKGSTPNGEAPSGEVPSGEAPSGEKSTDDSKDESSGEVPEKPEGEDNNSTSEDVDKKEKPSGDFSMLTLTGEEKTITITDESIISSRTTEGTESGLASIEVGSTLMLTYVEDTDGSETLSTVDVMGGLSGGPSNDKGSNDSSDGASTEDNSDTSDTNETQP